MYLSSINIDIIIGLSCIFLLALVAILFSLIIRSQLNTMVEDSKKDIKKLSSKGIYLVEQLKKAGIPYKQDDSRIEVLGLMISLSDVFWLNIYLKDNQIKINANDTIEGYNISDYCFKLKVNKFIIDYIKYTSQLAIE